MSKNMASEGVSFPDNGQTFAFWDRSDPDCPVFLYKFSKPSQGRIGCVSCPSQVFALLSRFSLSCSLSPPCRARGMHAAIFRACFPDSLELLASNVLRGPFATCRHGLRALSDEANVPSHSAELRRQHLIDVRRIHGLSCTLVLRSMCGAVSEFSALFLDVFDVTNARKKGMSHLWSVLACVVRLLMS